MTPGKQQRAVLSAQEHLKGPLQRSCYLEMHAKHKIATQKKSPLCVCSEQFQQLAKHPWGLAGLVGEPATLASLTALGPCCSNPGSSLGGYWHLLVLKEGSWPHVSKATGTWLFPLCLSPLEASAPSCQRDAVPEVELEWLRGTLGGPGVRRWLDVCGMGLG